MTVDVKLFFSSELLDWYRRNKRDLPWRQSKDPYRVWVSEIMLQQTRVDTVIPYYERFMDKFPTIKALAGAPESEVLKMWEGLGYYSRARNLQAGAREVMALYGGAVPDDAPSVAALKGVGPYTKGAIMSIAFNRPEPAVDGNVMRVLSRYFCLEEDIAKARTRVNIEVLAASLIPEGAAGDFNQGLMELGALVCTPKSPGCLTCPVMAHCAGRLAGRELELPIKTKAKPPRPEQRFAAIVEGAGEYAGKVLVRQRPETGLLASMWELPHVLVPGGSGPAAAQAEQPQRGRGRKRAAAAYAAAAAPLGAGGADAAAGGQASAAVRAATAEPAATAAPAPEQAERMALLCRSLAEETRLLVRPRRWWMEAEHVFSHIIWDVQVYLADFGFVLEHNANQAEVLAAAESSGVYRTRQSSDALKASGSAEDQQLDSDRTCLDSHVNEQLPEGYRWIGLEDMRELAFPNVFLRILREYWEERD
ncbi:A/G-specific adenine glycosylase [Paenibacillus abyssi]|uniref:Adenine DNA glycosylase n=1 Tax=Paenibacillus abyssi TaxID=1340531 RepID=A0A917G5W0_9BACL|nr:A/G-specific adenine glycosylase [Paenibacillus abyssi]GGG24233.1 hypothetical protein GCM10010916_45960 [Paenibacillus abyssi]